MRFIGWYGFDGWRKSLATDEYWERDDVEFIQGGIREQKKWLNLGISSEKIALLQFLLLIVYWIKI
jgi:hypothetical protein